MRRRASWRTSWRCLYEPLTRTGFPDKRRPSRELTVCREAGRKALPQARSARGALAMSRSPSAQSGAKPPASDGRPTPRPTRRAAEAPRRPPRREGLSGREHGEPRAWRASGAVPALATGLRRRTGPRSRGPPGGASRSRGAAPRTRPGPRAAARPAGTARPARCRGPG